MKFFGQRDELFEIMAQAAARQRPGSGASSTPTPTPTPTPTTTTTTGGTTGTSSASNSRPVVPSNHHGRPSATTSVALARAGISTTTVRGGLPGVSPIVNNPLGKGELVEIEGDALVVIDDEAEVAPQPPTTPDGMRLFALRGDTAVVGGILVAGLLFGSFLLGRSTASPVSEEKAVEEAALPPDVEAERRQAQAQGTTSVPASVPREQAGQQSSQPAQPQAEPAAPPPVQRQAQGTQGIQVCHTSPEKAQGLAKWLNEDPRSPIFGRGDLEASAKGGSVRINGFARQEAEVMARVQATSDPTGGSGAFRDAYWVAVR